MESVWDFFDRVNDNIEIISAIMGVLGISLIGFFKLVLNIKWKNLRKEIKRCVIAVGVLLLGFFVMCIYASNLIVVPNIDNTSYEVAQQMLENKEIKYEILNLSEYEGVVLKNTTVSLANCNGGEHISKDKVVILEIIYVNEETVEEDSHVIDGEEVTEIEEPYADVYVYLQEVMVYKILDGGGKTPILSKDVEIIPNTIRLYNNKYGVEYTNYSDVRDSMLNIRGCLFSSIPCGEYELTINADGYIDYSSEIDILPENLVEGKENVLIAMNSQSAGELVPFTICIYDETYNHITGDIAETYIRTNENDMFQYIELTDEGMISNYGLLAANGVEFDVMVSMDGRDYLSHIHLQDEQYSIVIILNDDGTTRVTTIQELYWVE